MLKLIPVTLLLSTLFLVNVSLAPAAAPTATTEASSVFFCFWNVENFFDDKVDKRNTVDQDFDVAFAEDENLLKLKLDRLTTVILKMNGGKGPDVLALAEVESVRAAELLQKALNKKLKDSNADDALQYKFVVMRNLDAGRHIAPAVISRVNVALPFTKMLGRQLRILECHLYVNGPALTIIASHWTSQLKQKEGGAGENGREKYAVTIYEAFRAATKKNPATDFLVCGDFNDTPDSETVVKSLGALADKTKVKVLVDEDQPFLNLMAGKDPTKFGTIWYNQKPLIYDQLCVSAGLLDEKGWSVDPTSVSTVTDGLIRKGATRREPWRFGHPKQDIRDEDRGYSDHFPVTLRLKVQPPDVKK